MTKQTEKQKRAVVKSIVAKATAKVATNTNPAAAMRANGWKLMQVWVEPPLWKAVDDRSRADGVSKSAVLREVLNAAFPLPEKLRNRRFKRSGNK